MSFAPMNLVAPMPGLAPQYAQATSLPMVNGMGLPLAAAGPMVVTPQMARAMAAQQQMGMGPMPMGAAQGVLGAAGAKPPSKIGSIIKNVLVFGGLGAALGAGATMLPFIPGGPLTGALIGGVAGAIFGIIKGLRSGDNPAQLNAMQGVPADPTLLGPPITVRPPRSRPKKVGQRVKRPTAAKHYTVRKGDTLAAIAARHKLDWHKLYASNRKLIGENPGSIKIGVKLVLPAKAKTARKD